MLFYNWEAIVTILILLHCKQTDHRDDIFTSAGSDLTLGCELGVGVIPRKPPIRKIHLGNVPVLNRVLFTAIAELLKKHIHVALVHDVQVAQSLKIPVQYSTNPLVLLYSH